MKDADFVVHEMKNLRKLCEQALWLERGQVRIFGRCGEVLDANETAPPPTIP